MKLNRADKIAKTIKGFSLTELLDLNYALNEEIDHRQEQGELDLPAISLDDKQDAKTERSVYTKCGKASCRCANGELLHGPYRYQYWREAGRLRSRYLGKEKKLL